MSREQLTDIIIKGLDAGLTKDQILRLGKQTTADS